MPKTHVSKSITIDRSAEEIFSKLNDFNQWPQWSPWLICEPDARVEVAPDAKYYEWEGKRVGSGNMRIINEQPNDSIDYDLTFSDALEIHGQGSIRIASIPVSPPR